MWQLANYNHSTILRLYGECGGMALYILLIFCMLLLCKCNCNCNLAHESLAFPFVFCNYALSWIVSTSLTLSLFSFLRFKLQVLHLITAHISQISPRRFSGVVSATLHYHYHPYLLSAICISPTVVCMYLQPNLRRAAPTLCSLCISLCGRGCICCHVPRFIFPSRLEIVLGKFSEEMAKPPVKSFAY